MWSIARWSTPPICRTICALTRRCCGRVRTATVHYPLRGGKQYNLVVTFHSREKEEWGVRDGSKEEVLSYFKGIHPRPRQMLDKPTSGGAGPPPTASR